MDIQNTVLAMFFILSLQTLVLSSQSGSITPKPHQLLPSVAFPKAQHHENLQQRVCSYALTIKTSCSSPKRTRDYIGIYFGDVHKNEVSIPRIDVPASRSTSRAFEQCSRDTFNVQGSCVYGTCYLYLRRDGYDGWFPESVTVYENKNGRSYTFGYGVPLPNAAWRGFTHCPKYAAAKVKNDHS
uniref:Peroxidase ATP17a-like protein n=1 Tax=Allium sativum TaxID=4682 RepID=H2CLX6_ALLSA|nr:peroxidase ATP17a-like protein [Allium sativum]